MIVTNGKKFRITLQHVTATQCLSPNVTFSPATCGVPFVSKLNFEGF